MIPDWIKFLVFIHLLVAVVAVAGRPQNHERLTVREPFRWDELDTSPNIEDRRR